MFYVIFVEVNYIKRDTVNNIDSEIGLLEEKNIKNLVLNNKHKTDKP